MEKWEDVRPLIEGADKHLHDALSAFYDTASKQAQKKLRVMLTEYEYCDVLLSEGVPILPSGDTFDNDFIVSRALPLGIVVGGCLEVVDGNTTQSTNTSFPPTSLAHLRVGDFVGIFEALDFDPHNNTQSLPDWTVYSGVNTIHPLEDLETSGRHQKRTRHFGSSVALNEFKRASMFGQQIKLYKSYLSDTFSWKTTIVFLSKGWFEELFRNDIGGTAELFALRARDIMWQKAWHSVTSTRNIHSTSYKYFSAAGVGKKADKQAANLAYRIFVSLVDVAIGRKPFYVFDRDTCEVAPVGNIHEEFLKLEKLNGGVMRPEFASPKNSVGYLPFYYLLPELISGKAATASASEKIFEAFSKIDEAGEALPPADQGGESVPFLRGFPHLIERISTRVPGEAGAVKCNTFKHDNGLKKLNEKEMVFFEQIPKSFKPKSSSFFRHCMKFDLRNFRWE